MSVATTGGATPRALVFDLDGTLVDTRDDIAAACNHALGLVGRDPLPTTEIASFVGDGSRVLMARALGLRVDDPMTERAFDAFSVYYASHPADHTRWMLGAKECLEACAHLPLALVTNKPRVATVPLLDALDIASCFRVVVAGGDGPLKPDPAAIHSALAPLRIDAREAWVIGDGPQDIAAGRAAGAFTVGVLGGFAREAALRESVPDLLLRDLRELPALLRATPR